MTGHTLSRRQFFKGSAAALAATTTLNGSVSSQALAALDPHASSNRVFHATHYGPFEAVVESGELINIASMPELDARPTAMLQLGVVDRTYDKSRVRYPMIRKSYLENWNKNDRKPELRGKEPFVRVDWDTALRLTSKAILDTIETHGNEALFSASYGGWSHAGLMRPNVLQGRFFNLLGGNTPTVQDYSAGASQICLPYVIGDMETYSPQTSWEDILEHTEVFFFVACNPIQTNRIEYRVADHQMHANWERLRDSGVHFIAINPQKTSTNEFLNADWVKIVPNTDVALFLAMSYHVLANEQEDRTFLNTYTVGSDKFISYVKGEDGSDPKTPAWAAGITGIPEEKIIELAETCADNRCQFAGGWSLQRAHHGEMTHWAMINFASLLGKIGRPGEGVGFSWHYGNGGMPQSGKAMPTGLSQGENPVKAVIPASRINEMLLNPGKEFPHNGETRVFPDVKFVYAAGNNFISHQQDLNELIGALQKVDTVVVQDPWWCASTRWADIVLPATSTLERNDISSGGTYSNDKIYAMKKVIEPVGESLDDFEIFRRLAAMFGLEHRFTEGLEVMDHLRESYGRSDATEPFEVFWERGYTRLEMPEEARDWVRHAAFRDDPDGNPLHTESGKIEMFSQTIADFEIPDCPGMPKWLEPAEYLGNAKEGDVHVVSPHPWYRLHSQMDNSERLRRLYKVQGREPVLINTADAEANGIEEGDLVKLFNERGTIIAGAVVSDRIMPGVVSLYEGGWPQLDAKGRCNSGQINFITSSRSSSGLSQATAANTCVASLRKCTDAEGPNRAHQPPEIQETADYAAITDTSVGLRRIGDIARNIGVDMSPGEKLFYERCTACHGPRNPPDYTQREWRGITNSMFPRAGLQPDEKEQVMEFLLNNAKDAVK